jgi:hypothetical protein
MVMVVLLLLASGTAALGDNLDVFRNSAVDLWIADLAHGHVEATRDWARSDYEVWLIRKVQDHVEVWVINLRDLETAADDTATLGGGESFSLFIDAASKRVVRELYFQ